MAVAKRQYKSAPIPNGSNGRDKTGRFTIGNPGGPGNPRAKRTAEFQAIFDKVLTPKRWQRVIDAVLKKAEQGNLAAINIIIERELGRPLTGDHRERLEALERRIYGAAKG